MEHGASPAKASTTDKETPHPRVERDPYSVAMEYFDKHSIVPMFEVSITLWTNIKSFYEILPSGWSRNLVKLGFTV